MNNIGIIGMGKFGRLIARELSPFLSISAFSNSCVEQDLPPNVHLETLDEVLKQELIIIALPAQYLIEFCLKNKELFNPQAVVIDVCSVKVKPLATLMKYLPSSCEIVGTHPLFGPVGAAEGLAGLKITICRGRGEHGYQLVKDFCRDKLQLKVLEKTAAEHDQDMAYIQGLTYFIAEILADVKIKDYDQKTLSYTKLLELQEVTREASQDLLLSIEQENPYAGEMRSKLAQSLQKIISKYNL